MQTCGHTPAHASCMQKRLQLTHRNTHTYTLHYNSLESPQPRDFFLHTWGTALGCHGHPEGNRYWPTPLPLPSCLPVPWCLQLWGWPSLLLLSPLLALALTGPSRPPCVVPAKAEGRGLHGGGFSGCWAWTALRHGCGLVFTPT